MKILLIEDEQSVASALKRGLTEEGFEVSIALDGLTGLQMGKSHAFDLIILDLMLPKINGIEVCRNFRKEGSTIPILMLTALGSTENIVTGLDNGADDYMVKPFKFAELAARIRTLSRRSRTQVVPNTIFKIADLIVDIDAKTVERKGIPINLTATEFRLLELFLKNQKRVLSRIQILEHVWDIDFNLGTNVVDVYVNYLRKKIDKDHSQKLIHTVIGMGYIFKPED